MEKDKGIEANKLAASEFAAREVEDHDLTQDRRLALHTLLHYYLAHNTDGLAHNTDDRSVSDKHRPLGETELFYKLYTKEWKTIDADRTLALKSYRNFLRTASQKRSSFVYQYFKRKMTVQVYFEKSPKFVQEAITVAFEYRPSPSGASLREVFENLSKEDRAYWGRLGEIYGGVWDIFRYSGHAGTNHRPPKDPRVMRAAMEVNAPSSSEEPPTFEVRYKPGGPGEAVRSSSGYILSLGKGKHMQFVGWESPDRYPINIVAPQRSDGGFNTFIGLVTRFHEYEFFIASRAVFLRSSAPSLEVLKQFAGMYKRTEVRDMLKRDHGEINDSVFDDLMRAILNEVPVKGMSALQLKRT